MNSIHSNESGYKKEHQMCHFFVKEIDYVIDFVTMIEAEVEDPTKQRQDFKERY